MISKDLLIIIPVSTWNALKVKAIIPPLQPGQYRLVRYLEPWECKVEATEEYLERVGKIPEGYVLVWVRGDWRVMKPLAYKDKLLMKPEDCKKAGI